VEVLADAAIWVVLLLAVLLLLHRALRQIVLRRSVTPPRNVITVCCPGGGVFFWWQIGAMRAATGACRALGCLNWSARRGAGAVRRRHTDAAHKSANRLAEEAGCFSNPFGLCGVCGDGLCTRGSTRSYPRMRRRTAQAAAGSW
jgi:hypothetical protein